MPERAVSPSPMSAGADMTSMCMRSEAAGRTCHPGLGFAASAPWASARNPPATSTGRPGRTPATCRVAVTASKSAVSRGGTQPGGWGSRGLGGCGVLGSSGRSGLLGGSLGTGDGAGVSGLEGAASSVLGRPASPGASSLFSGLSADGPAGGPVDGSAWGTDGDAAGGSAGSGVGLSAGGVSGGPGDSGSRGAGGAGGSGGSGGPRSLGAGGSGRARSTMASVRSATDTSAVRTEEAEKAARVTPGRTALPSTKAMASPWASSTRP